MTALALKKELLLMISQIEDVTTLKSIKNLIKEERKASMLTELQKKTIAKSEEDISNGDVVEHKIAMKQVADKYGW